MKIDLITSRLYNQQIIKPAFEKAGDLVKYFGAIQAQDFGQAKWAIGLRLKKVKDAAIENAFQKGEIIRTHVLRPTWHFVSPDDVRSFLMLTSPRIKAFSKYHLNQYAITEAILKKSSSIFQKILSQQQLTRLEIAEQLRLKKIDTNDIRLSLLLMSAELDGLICSGGRKGKQFTYALMDERVPYMKPAAKEEALYRLAYTYFTSHGPATLQDFTWWSGLSGSEANKGLQLVADQMQSLAIDNKLYWFRESHTKKLNDIKLLPNYDEMIVGYKDRSSLLYKDDTDTNYLFKNTILVKGKIAGTWKRSFIKSDVQVSAEITHNKESVDKRLLEKAIQQFKIFYK